MSANRDKCYEDSLIEDLKDPAEAAAYLDATLELNDQGALLVALRQVAKAHGMAAHTQPDDADRPPVSARSASMVRDREPPDDR